MQRSHRIILFLIAVLAFGTLAFGILQLLGAHREAKVPGHRTQEASEKKPRMDTSAGE
ncbi:MAG TPA: hypothetical protein VLT36_22610 [Candidatus Dormibacteraeota bacterium]|nr:hypothetical protein [Candidatus Dormibacteraeota bacterium]